MAENNTTPPTNRIGLKRIDYLGNKSTLCTGCGHDSISNALISALYQGSINPYKVVKLSGIGCSSKSTAYFSNKSHGFNAIHGRMASVATGVKITNPSLLALGISGDGDTANIGLGAFCHLIRRNLPIVYIVENNGVYGLTKGQFSATAELNGKLKSGKLNPFMQVDICSLAITLGATFVARSFSGDAKQLVPLLQAAFHHNGIAVIDIVSPCVTFNNHDDSLRSYTHIKNNQSTLHSLGFIPEYEEKNISDTDSETQIVELHDGSKLLLKKIHKEHHSIYDSQKALQMIDEHNQKGILLTGLFYLNSQKRSSHDIQNNKPLSYLTEEDTRPSKEAFEEILKKFR